MCSPSGKRIRTATIRVAPGLVMKNVPQETIPKKDNKHSATSSSSIREDYSSTFSTTQEKQFIVSEPRSLNSSRSTSPCSDGEGWSSCSAVAEEKQPILAAASSVALTASRKRPLEKQRDTSSLSVRFDVVEIREYSITLGDNPSVTSGPPLTLDWHHHTEYSVKVDDYEWDRFPHRNRCNLRIPACLRQMMLMGKFSQSQLLDCIQEIDAIQQQRRRTACRPACLNKVEEVGEVMKRKLMRGIGGRRKKQQQPPRCILAH